jgi:hypothetical protein
VPVPVFPKTPKKEAVLARQGAQQALRNELKGTVTALLLSCEMALQAPNLETFAENACSLRIGPGDVRETGSIGVRD